MPKNETVQLHLPLTQEPDDTQTTKPPEGEAELMPAVGEWAAARIAMIGMPKHAKAKRVRRPVMPVMPDDEPKGGSDKSEV